MFSIEVIQALNHAPARDSGADAREVDAPDPAELAALRRYGQVVTDEDGVEYIGITGARVPLIGGSDEILARSNAETVAQHFADAETVDGWIAVPLDSPDAREAAEVALGLREQYPIFDEEDYSAREWEEVSAWLREEYGGALAEHISRHPDFYGTVDDDNAPDIIPELARGWAEAVYLSRLVTHAEPVELPSVEAVRELVVYADRRDGIDRLHVEILREYHNALVVV